MQLLTETIFTPHVSAYLTLNCGTSQLSFFQTMMAVLLLALMRQMRESRSKRKLMLIFDRINQSFGRNTIKLAAVGNSSPWSMRSAFKSPSYTTQWGIYRELLFFNFFNVFAEKLRYFLI